MVSPLASVFISYKVYIHESEKDFRNVVKEVLVGTTPLHSIDPSEKRRVDSLYEIEKYRHNYPFTWENHIQFTRTLDQLITYESRLTRGTLKKLDNFQRLILGVTYFVNDGGRLKDWTHYCPSTFLLSKIDNENCVNLCKSSEAVEYYKSFPNYKLDDSYALGPNPCVNKKGDEMKACRLALCFNSGIKVSAQQLGLSIRSEIDRFVLFSGIF